MDNDSGKELRNDNYSELVDEVRKIKSLLAFVLASQGTELTEDKRMRILEYGGFSQSQIAELIGVNQSTVSRHLKKG